MSLKPDNSLDYRLAESVDISPDATTFTFHLRPGMHWSDGAPFTSQDVLFSYNLFAHKDSWWAPVKLAGVKGITEYQEGQADSVAGFSAPDDNTFVIELATPQASFPVSLAELNMFVMPEHVLGSDITPAELETSPFAFSGPIVGMGPFQFVRYQTDQFVEVACNPYFRTPVGLEQVILKFVDASTVSAQLETGEIQASQVSPSDFTTLGSSSNLKVTNARNATGLQVAINTAKPALSDKRVRQAFQYAIDRDAIIESVFAGLGSTADTYIFGPEEFQSKTRGTYTYDPEKARQLLAEANWDPNTVLKAYTRAGIKVREDTLLAIQGYLADVGVKIDVLPSEPDVLGKVAYPKPDDPNGMDFYLGGTYLGEPDPDLIWEPGYKCGTSEANFCNEALDALFLEARQSGDQARRAELYQQIDGILFDESVYIFFLPDSLYGVRNEVSGFVPHSQYFYMYWNLSDWKVAP